MRIPRRIISLAALAWTALPIAWGAETPMVADSSTQYTLRSGDQLQYRIAEDPVRGQHPFTVGVNSVGEVNFPVCRDSDIRITVQVRGKTIPEVKAELTRKLLASYYNKATVELALAEKILNPGKVQFFGEITGTIPIRPDSPVLMLSDAILQLGQNEFADLSRVKVHRMDPVTQTERIIKKDVKGILRGSKRDEDIPLQDGDRVEVPQKWLN